MRSRRGYLCPKAGSALGADAAGSRTDRKARMRSTRSCGDTRRVTPGASGGPSSIGRRVGAAVGHRPDAGRWLYAALFLGGPLVMEQAATPGGKQPQAQREEAEPDQADEHGTQSGSGEEPSSE